MSVSDLFPTETDHGVTSTPRDRARGGPRSVERIGRYVVQGVLGTGGMAVVYLARDPVLDRTVALKIMHGDGDGGRLLREAQALARISHPNVIHVYEVGREQDFVYIAMERIEGITVAEWLRVPRTRDAILGVFLAAGRGLTAAHDAGLVHRDFKPENVMVGRDGRVCVLDFGLARSQSDPGADDTQPATSGATGALLGATMTGAVAGTPAYMSPEQWRGEHPSARSDQYSYCVSLARALIGAHPFDITSHERLRAAVLAGEVVLPRSIPRALRNTLRRGMAVDPAARFGSLAQMMRSIVPRPRWQTPALVAAVVVAVGVVTAIVRWPAASAHAPTTVVYRAPRQLTSSGDVGAASVSPDGQTVALLTRDALVLQPIDVTRPPRVIARGRFAYYTLAWSPDGRTIGVVAAVAGDAGAPGLVIVDVASGTARRIADNLGMIALLGGDKLAAVRFAGRAVAFYSIRDPSQPTRVCPLPEPFTGIRSLRFDAASDSLLVQLDLNDSESELVRVDRACTRTERAAGPVAALSFVVRSSDHRILARMLGRNDLVELEGGTQRVLQTSDYEPLAIDAAGDVIHLDRFTRWQLTSLDASDSREELSSGTAESRFAIAPDGVTVAHVDNVAGRGELRIGTLGSLRAGLEVIRLGAVRAAWSPDGRQLGVLTHGDLGYEVTIYTSEARTWSSSRPVAIRYDAEMVWLDDRRIAFATPHAYRGFAWIDPASGATGLLAVGDGQPTTSLARAHRSYDLAFVTETSATIDVWKIDGGHASRVTSIPVTSPRASRRAHVTWAADDATLLAFDGLSGERWSVRVADGVVERLPSLTLPSSGGFAELTEMLALPDRLVLQTVTRSADVAISRPLERE